MNHLRLILRLLPALCVALIWAAPSRAQETPAPAAAPPTANGEMSPAADADDATEDEAPLRRLDQPAAEDAPADEVESVEEAVEAADEVEPAAPSAPSAPAAPSIELRHNEMVRIGSDALLAADETAGEVVAIGGNVVVDGTVRQAAVAVMGDTTINGSAGEAVAVMGTVTVNGHVRGEVVAVMGNIQLGPNAQVDGELVCVGGQIIRAPGAVVRGPVQQVGPFPFLTDGAESIRTWFQKCLVLGRPLAFDSRLLWFWGAALVFLGLYLLFALVFNRGVIACAETLEKRPGMTLAVAVLTALLAPLLTILLSFIGVGLVLVPLLFIAGLFGKAAFLAWLGRRILQPLGWQHSFPAVLVGGVILLLLYTVPFAGFILMTLTNSVGLGMVVYAIIGAARSPSTPTVPPAIASPAPSAPLPPAPPPVAPAPIPRTGMAAAAVGVDVSNGLSVEASPAQNPTPQMPPPSSYSPPPVPPPVPAATAAAVALPAQLSLLPRAGFWIRLAASLIDAILLAIVVNMINIEDYFLLFFAAYCVVLWALRATTIGGIICGLKVVRIDDRKLDWTISVVRGLGGFLSLAIVGLGFIWVLFDDDRQSWHDKIAGTTIVRMPKGAPLI